MSGLCLAAGEIDAALSFAEQEKSEGTRGAIARTGASSLRGVARMISNPCWPCTKPSRDSCHLRLRKA